MDRELYMTALHVLAKFASGEKPDPIQVGALRGNALPEEADLPIDELCCQMIHRYYEGPRVRFEKLA